MARIKKHSVPVKAALFDLYGTLFIQEMPRMSLLEKYKKTKPRIDNLVKKYGGNLSGRQLIIDFISEVRKEHKVQKKHTAHPEIVVENLWKKLLGISASEAKQFASEFESIMNPVYLREGTEETLQILNEWGLYLGIISNAQFYTIDVFKDLFNKSLPEMNFREELTFFSFRFREAKPGRIMFRKAIDNLAEKNISPSECLFVGNDLEADIGPSNEEGFISVFYCRDMNIFKRWRAARLPRQPGQKPQYMITDITQLQGIVKNSRR
ncbi:MAG: HAD family hydrolase [Spirochaetales bacterium]|nr:HAD family hydrolase [Spirochaetales bacterium]